MEFFENVDVGKLTTFAIPAKASLFVEINSMGELDNLVDFLESYEGEFLLLGGGSNTVFVEDYKGLVVKINMEGWEIISESESEVLVKVEAGTNWHEFVMWAVENDFGGLENLALIPGNVGTAPVQNIGAYGVEVKDVIRRLDFYDFEKKKVVKLLNDECKFGYRDSIFKNEMKQKGVITAVEFRLSKKGFHKLNTSYKPVAQAVKGMEEIGVADLANIIIEIRSGKLPDWKKVGTAGSFFKNPIVDKFVVDSIKAEFEDVPVYEFGDKYKLAAGWLIDRCGLKGIDFGTIGVYEKQALVLVNKLGKGPALGEDLENAIKSIKSCVSEKFGVDLECEVNVIGLNI